MSTIKELYPYARLGNGGGVVLELDDGSLIRAGDSVAGTKGIKKSIDNGATWVLKQEFPSSSMQCRCNFIDQQGNIYIGTEVTTTQSLLYRSTDDGETWSLVLTAESSSLWRIAQQSDGTMYLNEYSIGNQDASELYAYNVYRSIDNGATWQVWYTATEQTTPGAKDGIRHVHGIWCDSQNRLFIGFGDLTYAGENSKAYEISSDGVLGTLISDDDNGFTALAETDDGKLLFGGDAAPFRVAQWDPDTNVLTEKCHIVNSFGSRFGTAILDMVKGKDGVIYCLTNGSGTKHSVLLASGDDGETWSLMYYSRDVVGATFLSLNRNRPGSRLYISRAQSSSRVYVSLPDFTRNEVLTKRLVVR